ncbi:HD-GYP domain-containing protein [Clostridium sp. DJ247]|uniref:HD-GYP domain-containing protein n=1 Tax=Clostridium sp. DJ247 TaxID=2726188 RepID=UPI001628F2E4|nr:HD-GYP domain-containing protein [Clostridium sp. DJ247]MBC2582406.1 HD-GYP domain-containing protein [Clostridium sp. DJ247]
MGKNECKISIYDMKPGMIIAEDIKVNNTILISRETVVTDNMIKKLQEKFIQLEVIIYSDKEEQNENKIHKVSIRRTVEEVRENFIKISHDLESLFDNINRIGKINIDEVRNFAKRIQIYLDSPYEVIKNIVLNGSGNDPIYIHSVNVAALSSILGKWVGLNDKEISLLTYSAILHDFGKTKVGENIMLKSQRLTRKEFEQVKLHPIIAYNLTKQIPYLNNSVIYGILMHHERLDGSGYPLGIKEGKIHPFARIIAIVDIFDAVNSDRNYKKSLDPLSALEIIKRESLGKLDYKFSKIFIEQMVNYYMGEEVMLNNQKIGKIVYLDINNLSRPLLFNDDDFLDLKSQTNLHVQKLVK